MNRSKNFLAVALLIVALFCVAGYYLLYMKPSSLTVSPAPPAPPPQVVEVFITKVRGNLKSIEGNKIFLDAASATSSSPTGESQSEQSQSFLTDEATTWKKRELTLPSSKSLQESGTTFRRIEITPSQNKESTGSLEDLKNALLQEAVFVDADIRAQGSGEAKDIVASNVFYQIIHIEPK